MRMQDIKQDILCSVFFINSPPFVRDILADITGCEWHT